MIPQTVAIALPIEENNLHFFYEWGRIHDFSHVTSVHFLHVVKVTITPLEFGLVEAPDENTFQEMRPTLLKFLQDEAKKILPSDFKGSSSFYVSHDYHPEEEVIKILKMLKASLLVVSTRGKHGIEGFFHHSFTEHMIKNSPCDVLVIRPQETLKTA